MRRNFATVSTATITNHQTKFFSHPITKHWRLDRDSQPIQFTPIALGFIERDQQDLLHFQYIIQCVKIQPEQLTTMCGNWISGIARRIGLQYSPRSDLYEASGKPMEKRALIVIDVQNDFISGSLALSNCPSKHDGSEVVPPINKIITSQFWDLVVYSKDWHPPDHISFVTNAKNYKPHADNKADMEKAEVFDYCIFDVDGVKVDQVLWPAHCIQNSEGAEFHKDLKIVTDSITVHKGTNPGIDSYSAFFDNNRRSETSLRKILQDAGITEVYVCGLATDVCVNFTAFDSHSLGFKTVVIEDCCRGVDSEKCAETFRRIKEAGMDVLMSDEVLQRAKMTSDQRIQSHASVMGCHYL